MKSLYILWLLLFSIPAFSQISITAYPLSIGMNKTSNLIFPYSIISVDRGSPDIVAQKAKGADNILQLKAARANFASTNLSVITSDGKLSSFTITYAADPTVLNISFEHDNRNSLKKLNDHQILLTARALNEFILQSDARIVLEQKHFFHQRVNSNGIKLFLRGIYIKDDLLWFSLEMENSSFLDYNTNYLHCFIQDQTKTERNALQEIELPAEYPLSLPPSTRGKKRQAFVLAFSPFTFSRDKKMIIQISEKNGGRMLSLGISHKSVLKARACSASSL
jgi:conjugative transposon TraN protein